MEERALIPELSLDVIAVMLRHIRMTCEVEQEDGLYCMQVREFPLAIESGETYEGCIDALIKGMKDSARVLASDFDNWRLGRESEIPYLLKVLLSSESELRECLNIEKCGGI